MGAEERLQTNRFSEWVEAVCRTYVKLDVGLLGDRPFTAGIDVTPLGGSVFAELNGTAQHVVRRQSDISGSDGEFAILIVQQSGTTIIAQDGRETLLRPGDGAIVDTARPYTLHIPEPIGQLVLHCPRHQLRGRLRSMRAVTAARLSSRTPTGALLTGSLAALARQRHALTPDQGQAVARYTLDLLALALEATPEAGESVLAPGAGPLLNRIRAYIRDNLADPELDPATVAAAHGISVRHLHRLFYMSGTTCGDWIRGNRLERCRAELESPRLRERSVTEIALRWGFSDSAHFSRAFKHRFGVPPSAVRPSRE